MYTLNNFFNTQKGSPEWAKRITQSPGFVRARQCITDDLAGCQIPATFHEFLILKLCEALEIEVGSILVWGWRKRGEIVRYRDKTNPPGASHRVPLLEHTLVSKHSPTLQPVINGVKVPVKLAFDILLKLQIQGAMLMIRDGKVMEVKTGVCTGSGAVEYSGFTVLEKKTAPLDLPDMLTFKQGIPI